MIHMSPEDLAMKSIGILSTLFAAALAISSCGGSNSSPQQSTVSFNITDAPVDNVNLVKLTIDGIALKPKNSDRVTIDFDEPVIIANLLNLTGSLSEPILANTVVEPGEYVNIRLFVVGGSPASIVEEENGQQFPLLLPGQQGQSTQRRFLQLVTPFVIPTGASADFTIDVELRKALTKPNGNDHYLLRPALRLVNNIEVGSISGAVDEALFADIDCNYNPVEDEGLAVYLYSESNAAIGDVNVNESGEVDHDVDDSDGVTPETNPLTLANVKFDSETTSYRYEIGFLTPGEYSIALTCQSLEDAPETDDDILFLDSDNVIVEANAETVYDFSVTL